MKKEKVDVAIIGAGPSGTVSASYLRQQGISVKIIEKSKFPRYSIGESLIPRCMDNFEEAGLLDCLQKQNYQVKTGARFIKNGKKSEFDFSKKFPKITLTKPEMCTFDDMLEFKNINQIF